VLKVLDLCKALMRFLDDQGRQLSSHEAACFLPCLVEKAGHNAVRHNSPNSHKDSLY
jgi:hypothetical protein